MKGTSLPINTIIILVLGVIVMLGLIGFFTLQFRNTSSSINPSVLFQKACSKWQLVDCDPNQWESIKVEGLTVKQICNLTGFNISSPQQCKKACCGS